MRSCCQLLCVVIVMVCGNEGCVDHAIFDLTALQKMVENWGDILLYSPDLQVIEICWKETLECFKSELKVLDFEFDGAQKKNVSDVVLKLNLIFEQFLTHLAAL